MKKIIRTLCMIYAVAIATSANAQCPGGYNQVTLNWDYLDYFVYSGNYTSANGYLPGVSWAQTQNFAFGTQRLTITNNYTATNIGGDVATHTGDGGGYGTGDDIQFTGNGTITFTFQNAVSNLKFSLYDIDLSQRVQFSATNGATPVVINLSKVSGTLLSFTNNGTTSARADALATTVANSNTDGTVNVDITGPVTQVTLTISNTGTCGSGCGTGGSEAGVFFISDVTACSAGNFPTNYYNVSKPFTGQASYVLTSLDKSVYAVNTSTGFSRFLFTDNTSPFGGSSFINSMAYDPYRRILYYVYSLTGSPSTNAMLKKYDFNTGTISTVLSDITSTTYGTGVGIPVTDYAGVESGAAAFYGGSLYLGIETSNSSRNSGREAVIWRIDFDGSNIPYRSSQLYAVPVDNGNLLHDWADFAINDGILYDFDAANQGNTPTDFDIYQMNMMTGAVSNYTNPSWIPGQNTVGWDGKVYQIYAYNTGGTGSDVAPYIALYNGAGGIGTTTNLSAIPAIPFPNPPSLGDAAEAFRWPVDFGDAPASYDPVGSDPGVNEISSNLYLGSNKDEEVVTRGQTALANSDNYDDGLPVVHVFNPLSNTYLTSVNVLNNTGANATVCAWLDYNANGIFDPSEGITVTVPTNASTQSVYLYWPFISSSLSMGTYTYLRIRVTSTSNGMTTANPTGYFNNGEIEDYRVSVNTFPLEVQLLSFDAIKNNEKVNLNWQTAYEQVNTKYELQRSSDLKNWTTIQNTTVSQVASEHRYTDSDPLPGVSYYRLKTQDPMGVISYSQTRKIEFSDLITLKLTPNPALNVVKLNFNNSKTSIANLQVTDMTGKTVHKQNLTLQKGTNVITLPFVQKLLPGVYIIQIDVDTKNYNEKLIVRK